MGQNPAPCAQDRLIINVVAGMLRHLRLRRKSSELVNKALGMSLTDLQHIIQSKEAERRRLRALPWLEKLEMLDRLRERHLSLQRMQPRPAGTRVASR